MLKLEPVALTDVGRKRSVNQDYLGDYLFKSGRKYGQDKLKERGQLFAVADGMGGHAGGEIASELAITTLFERYYNGSSSGDVAIDLSTAMKEANLQVHSNGKGVGRAQMGTTLTLVLVKGNKGIFGNVGDSRTYIVRQGLVEQVTHDHSMVQEQIDAGVLTKEQAERSSIRNFITRTIGHNVEVEPDLFERELHVDDILLLCSDGLHGQVKELEMGTTIATAPNLKDAAQQLIDKANERGGPDNISVMLIRVEELGEKLPTLLANYQNKSKTLPKPVTPDPTVPNPDQDPTVPMLHVQSPPVQADLPIAPLVKPKKNSGLIVGLVFLAFVIGSAIAFWAFSNSFPSVIVVTPTVSDSPIPVGTATPTITSNATLSVAPLSTATPPAVVPTNDNKLNGITIIPFTPTPSRTSNTFGTIAPLVTFTAVNARLPTPTIGFLVNPTPIAP